MSKVLFVFNGPIFGGAERHTFDLAQGLMTCGLTPLIFAMKAGPLAAPENVRMLQPLRPCSLKTRIYDLSDCIKLERPDIIITVNERPVFASFLARKLAKSRAPIAAILHSTLLRSTKEKLLQLVYTPIINKVERVIYISANQRSYWLARSMKPKSEAIILNGIDTTRFSPLIRAQHRSSMRQSLGFSNDDIILGLSAVMRSEKNHIQAVRVLGKLRRKGIPVKLLLVGDGALRGEIEIYVHEQGLKEHVVFAGMQSDVRPYISAFDVGVICSISVETLSLSALEIMAMGVPMVMSDIGGASEIIDETTGRLFKPQDDEGFHDAFSSLLQKKVRESAGNSSRFKVEKHFDHSVMTKSYFENLSCLLG